MAEEKKSCFVIAPIGEPDSETRKRSDQVLRHIIGPAVEARGYKALRADEIDKPGIITSQVIQRVVNDPLVIADLTETNPNVFYELAIRHAIRKPLVQIIQKGERIPFDVAATRTIYFDHHDLDSVEDAKNEIIGQIKSLEKDSSDIETPISISLDLQLLRQSENPEERSLADLVAVVSDLRNSFDKIESRYTRHFPPELLDELRSFIKGIPKRIGKELMAQGVGVRRSGQIEPLMIRELVDMLPSRAGPLGILIILSFYRDQFPWVYEIGMEAYRRANSGDWIAAREIIANLRKVAQWSIGGPWMEEWIGSRKEAYMLMEELPLLLDRFIEEASAKRPRGRKAPALD